VTSTLFRRKAHVTLTEVLVSPVAVCVINDTDRFVAKWVFYWPRQPMTILFLTIVCTINTLKSNTYLSIT